MAPTRPKKKAKCKYYRPDTGKPKSKPCPRSSQVCWFVHPDEPEWDEIGGYSRRVSSSPGGYGRGRQESSSPRRGRGRSRSRSVSPSRGRMRRSRSRTRSSGKHLSPHGKRPRRSPPPRRSLYERIQSSQSPPPRSRSLPRSYSPHNRRPHGPRPRGRSPTPIPSSRGRTPPKHVKSDRSLRTVKVEPSTEAVHITPPNTDIPAHGGTNAAASPDQLPVPPAAPADQNHHHQVPPFLNSSLRGNAVGASTSSQPPPAQVDPFSPVFVPETPVIPGLSSSAQLTQPRPSAFSALQKSLELVIRGQGSDQAMQPSAAPPTVAPPTPIPEWERTEIWTTRVKLWADLMKSKSEVMDWGEEVKLAQSLKDRTGFDTFSSEAQAQIDSRIKYATTNLVQHQLEFEAFVSQSIALDRSVSKANAALAPVPVAPDPRAATPREIEWMEERIRAATTKADELEKKLAFQDQLLERLKAEQEAVAALPRLPSVDSPWSPMDVDDRDGLLDGVPSLKRKRTEDDDPRPPSRRRSLARNVADLREANEALVDRIAEAEGTIEGILDGVVEDPEGEECSRATRLKEIFQDYRRFIENAKTAADITESNSRVVEALKKEAERAISDWGNAYQEFQAVRKEAIEIHARAKQQEGEVSKKEEKIASMQREVETLNTTVQAFVEQQSAQPEEPLTLEQVIEALKPKLAEEMREATRPLLSRKHEELQQMLTDHIEAVRVSIYEPITLSEQVARTMVTWLEAEFGFGTTKR